MILNLVGRERKKRREKWKKTRNDAQFETQNKTFYDKRKEEEKRNATNSESKEF